MAKVSTTYLLRDVPITLWTRVKDRAADEDLALRDVMLGLLEHYAAGRLKLKTRSPQFVRAIR